MRPPPLAEKLLRFSLRGQAAELYGEDWKEVSFSRYGLTLPGWRNLIPLGRLRSVFWKAQQVESLQRECTRLAREVRKAREDKEAAEELAA